MVVTADQVTDAMLEDISSRGEKIYADLRPVLEPAMDRKFIAIHVDTGDYEVAKTATQAAKSIRTRQPLDGRVYVRKIGDEPEYGLASRLFARESVTPNNK